MVVTSFWLETAVSPYAALRSVGIAVLLAVLVMVVAGALARSLLLGALVASALIGLAWSKQLVAIPSSLAGRGQVVAAVLVSLALIGVVVLAVRILLRNRARITLSGATVVLNRAAALLLLAALGLGIINGRLAATASDLREGINLATWATEASGTPGERPDVYAILLDGYPRADVLDYAFDLDNSQFIGELEERGFTVAPGGHSDYLWTHVSLPSALNMAYVEQIPDMWAVMDGQLPRQPTLRRTVADNLVFEAARELGYTPVGVASGFEEVAPRQADVYVDGGQLNEFEISLLLSTWAGDAVAALAPDFGSSQQRQRILFNLEVLPRIAEIHDQDPVLVFAHVPAPHQPVVFGADGAPVAVPISDAYFADSPGERGEPADEFAARYRAQLPYLNARILEAIDGVLANSAVDPVIVLFADHGSASEVDWNVTEPDEADPARLLERTGILFAALTPGQDDVFPDDVSPVDLFRLLFDAYDGTAYGRATPPAGGGHVAPIDASVLESATDGR